MTRLARRTPRARGVNLMLMVQWPYGLMVTPAHVSASVKSPASLPVIVTLLIVSGAGSGLTTSTVWPALVVPTRCRPKSTALALRKAADGTGDGSGGGVVMKPGTIVRNAMGRGVTVGRRVGAAVAGGVAVWVGGFVGRGVDTVAGRMAGVLVGDGANVAVGRAVGVTVGSGVGVCVGCRVGVPVGGTGGVAVGRGVAVGTKRPRGRSICR